MINNSTNTPCDLRNIFFLKRVKWPLTVGNRYTRSHGRFSVNTTIYWNWREEGSRPRLVNTWFNNGPIYRERILLATSCNDDCNLAPRGMRWGVKVWKCEKCATAVRYVRNCIRRGGRMCWEWLREEQSRFNIKNDKTIQREISGVIKHVESKRRGGSWISAFGVTLRVIRSKSVSNEIFVEISEKCTIQMRCNAYSSNELEFSRRRAVFDAGESLLLVLITGTMSSLSNTSPPLAPFHLSSSQADVCRRCKV